MSRRVTFAVYAASLLVAAVFGDGGAARDFWPLLIGGALTLGLHWCGEDDERPDPS